MRKVLADSRIDLILLDLMLPGEDGLSLCRALRAESNIPIIMLTAKGDEVDRVIGLEMGADDYLPKPFGSRELIARIKAVLRRSQEQVATKAAEQRPKRYHFDRWALDTGARELLRDDGVTVPLSTGEYDLLIALGRASAARAESRSASRSGARAFCGRPRPQHRHPGQPSAQEAGARSERPEDHQDGVGRRLHVHARGEPRMSRLSSEQPVRADAACAACRADRFACGRIVDLHHRPRTGGARSRRICGRPAHRQSDPARAGSPARMAGTDRRRAERSDLSGLALGSTPGRDSDVRGRCTRPSGRPAWARDRPRGRPSSSRRCRGTPGTGRPCSCRPRRRRRQRRGRPPRRARGRRGIGAGRMAGRVLSLVLRTAKL